MEGNRRHHGEDGGRGEAEMEKSKGQVLQSEEANGQEKPPSANGRREPSGEARPGAVQPAVLAQRLCQTQTRNWPRGDRRGAHPPVCQSLPQHVQAYKS